MKRVLVLTYYWPPAGGPGVQRWLKFSRYLPEYDIEPIILTVDPNYAEYPIVDPSLDCEVLPEQLIFRTPATGIYEYYKKVTGSKSAPYSGFVNEGEPTFKQKISRFIRGNFFLPDARRGWNRFAYKKAISLIEEYSIDTVITTGPPMSTNLIGRALKRDKNIFWIADFRDPWTDIYYYDKLYPTPLAKRIDRKMERSVVVEADAVVTVSSYNRELLLQKSSNIDPSKLHVITNGYDAEDFQFKVEKAKNFTITYTGTLANDYSLDGFLRAISLLRKEGFSPEIKMVGKVDPEKRDKLEDQLGKSVTFTPFVPHKEAVRYMKSASMLLLIIPDTEGSRGTIPGKLFEYMGSGTPILSLAPPDGDVSAIIYQCHAGETFDYHDHNGIYLYVKEMIKRENERDCEEAMSNKKIEQFSRKTLSCKLAKIIYGNKD